MNKPIASRVTSLAQAIETISFPHKGLQTNLIAELKKIPRSGKYYRMKKFGIDLPCRSIFDHMNSLAYNADLLVDLLSLPVEKEKLANLFCFHDLAEVFVGDVPQFTSSEIAGAPVLSAEEKIIQEKEANLFILSIFAGSLKSDFAEYLDIDEQGITTELARAFHFFDRTDAIINIWRYIDRFRDSLDIELYLHAMNDFFINPSTISYSLCDATSDFILFLKNPEHAREYFYEKDKIFDKMPKNSIGQDAMLQLMDSSGFHYAI